MTEELAVYEGQDLAVAREPSVVLEEAQKAAKALTDVLSKKKKPVMFNNEQYLEFEDWQTVGRFYGITVQADDAEPVNLDDAVGFKAKARAFHGDRQVSSAVAYCMRDEGNWKNKPHFQLASMAQTRASAKALRNVLSWVVVLAGYKPTPAEEMEGVFATQSSPPETGSKGAVDPAKKAVEKPPPSPKKSSSEPMDEEEKNQLLRDLGTLVGVYSDKAQLSQEEALIYATSAGKFPGFKTIFGLKHRWQFENAINKLEESIIAIDAMNEEDVPL